jgi:hypothetical protein
MKFDSDVSSNGTCREVFYLLDNFRDQMGLDDVLS